MNASKELLTFNGINGATGQYETAPMPAEELARLACGQVLDPQHRVCEQRGEVKRARKLYEQSIVSALPEETNRAARAALARLAKRDGDLARGHELWESAVGSS